jgi:hypothetical protein
MHFSAHLRKYDSVITRWAQPALHSVFQFGDSWRECKSANVVGLLTVRWGDNGSLLEADTKSGYARFNIGKSARPKHVHGFR